MEDDLTIADRRIESDADSLLPGSKLHWYRIDSVLGQGDYWFTYLASDLNLDRPVIITEYMPCKIARRDTRGVIHPAAEHGAEYKAGLECFLTDAQKLAGIRHQNIAQALNAFEANNSAYIVVSHEQGKKAEQLFDGSTVAEKELLAFVLPILDGLEAIHASGYIHRYIEPSSIIIRPDGSPVLTGFNPGGGALFNPANTLTKHFPSGFAPIELYFGDGELHGPWTDIFSLGATLYQAVVGVAPVAAIERSRMFVQGGTDPLMSVLPVGQGNYSNAFLKAIDHALGFLPTQRPLTVPAWRNELSGKDWHGIAYVIRPESEEVAKLRDDHETHTLRAPEDHKRRAAERTNEEERTVKKLLDLARTAINEHDLQTAQTRLDEAAGIAPKSEAVASLRDELKAREIAVIQQRLVEETRHLQAEETANKLVALGRKALQANDIRMAEAHFDQAFVIRPESEQVAKLREDLETHTLRAQEDHKRRAAERTNEEERTVKKLLDLARTAINEHDLQTAQTRLDEAAGIAPKSEAVASLRDELKAREVAVIQQRLVEETRHLQAEETPNKLVALGRGRTGNQARPAVAGRRDGKIERIPTLNRSLQPADVPVNTPITNDRVRSTVDPSNETAGGSPPERDVRRRHRGKWLGYSAAIAGILGLGLSLAWMRPGSFAILYDAAEGWLSQNLLREEATETIPKPAAEVPVPEQLAPDSVAQGREDPAGEPTLSQPSLDQHIGTLLEAAKADLDAGRLTHPPGRNAIEKYWAVLALRPDVEEAIRAIQDIAARLISAAREALDRKQWDAARTRLDEAAVIAPESETVATLRNELKARQTRQVAIREVTPSRVRVRPGETVRFYTEYSLTLPASDKEALVKARWVLLRNGRKIGRDGIDNRYARAGLNTQVTELTLPPSAASGQYTVEHRVQVGDSFDVAHSRFVLAR
ncbi:MAG: hypothetical protein M3436_15605 [Pseudomonadota bacterium]|nr:hypothetical protein [Pseudomonadota bacterium]